MKLWKEIGILFIFAFMLSVAHGQVFMTAVINSSSTGTGSSATGTIWGVLSADMSKLTYQVTYANLQGTFTASHFHHRGELTDILFSGTTASGEWTGLTDVDIEELLRGRVYVNIHSTTAPGGEISGFLEPVQGIGFSVAMDGAQAGTSSTGRGTGWVVLDSSGARIRWNATVGGLTAAITAAHFHYSSGILHSTPFTSLTSSGTWSAVPDSVARLFARGQAYMNVHTSTFPGGEIHGAVKTASEITFTAELNSAGTGTGSSATGTIWGVLSADMSKLTYQVTYANLQGTFTASHFHHRGELTDILFSGTTASGEWTGLTDVDIEELLRGRVYVNIHSTTAPGGEISGFLEPVQGIGFSVAMDGAQAGTSSTGRGTGWVVLDSSGARIRWNATVGGLTAAITAAHFHYSSGILHSTPFTSLTSSGTWSAVPDSVARLFARGQAYMNVHTSTFPGGEIHGAVRLGSGTVTGVGAISRSLPRAFQLEQNYPNPFNPSTLIRYVVEKASHVSLKVFNLLGQEVVTLVNDLKPAGAYEVRFNAGRLASGVYLYQLTTDAGFSATRKLMVLR